MSESILNIRSSFISASKKTASNILANDNNGEIYASIRNSTFYLNTDNDNDSHIHIDNGTANNTHHFTLSDITFDSSVKSTYMIFNDGTAGNFKFDAVSPIIGNGLTLASNGATMVDTVSGGWIIGNINLLDQSIFDR